MRRGFLNKPNKPSGTTTGNTTELAASTDTTAPVKPTSDDLDSHITSNNRSVPVPEDLESTDMPKAIIVTRIPYYPTSLNEATTLAMLYGGTKEALYSLPNFFRTPVRFPPPSSLDWPFVIKDVPGMGKGVFAREDIPLGKLILHERLLLITPVAMCAPVQSVEELDQFLETFINQLDNKARMAFYRLHNCKGISVSRVLGIIHTNMLGIGMLPGPFRGEHAGLGLVLSRLNHSCSPNAVWTFDLDTLSMRLHACQAIPKGEQIFISYTHPLNPRHERQQDLLTKYSFACSCSACSLPKDEIAQSDLRRRLLLTAEERPDFEPRRLKDDVADWALSSLLPDDHITKSSLRIPEMLDEEKLIGTRPDLAAIHIMRLCMAYCALGDRESTVKWARRGLELAEAGLATGGEVGTRMWKRFLERSEKQDVWRLRVRRF